MNRYQIAIKNTSGKETIFEFPPTGNHKKVVKYMKYCIDKRGIFSARNISLGVVDTALVDLCSEFKTPIIMKTESEAHILIITQSYGEVYSLEKLPETMTGSRVICYDFPSSLLPPRLKPLLVIDSGRP
jgi:hypothetical protein